MLQRRNVSNSFIYFSFKERIQFVFGFGPTIDNKSNEPFMPVHPEIAYTKGIDMPLLIGYNSREGIIFLRGK